MARSQRLGLGPRASAVPPVLCMECIHCIIEERQDTVSLCFRMRAREVWYMLGKAWLHLPEIQHLKPYSSTTPFLHQAMLKGLKVRNGLESHGKKRKVLSQMQ